LKKSIKFARLLGKRSQGDEYSVNAGRYNLKRAAEMEFELYQQQRSLFLHTENVLIRESAQLVSFFITPELPGIFNVVRAFAWHQCLKHT
jgi:hypothetical protein